MNNRATIWSKLLPKYSFPFPGVLFHIDQKREANRCLGGKPSSIDIFSRKSFVWQQGHKHSLKILWTNITQPALFHLRPALVCPLDHLVPSSMLKIRDWRNGMFSRWSSYMELIFRGEVLLADSIAASARGAAFYFKSSLWVLRSMAARAVFYNPINSDWILAGRTNQSSLNPFLCTQNPGQHGKHDYVFINCKGRTFGPLAAVFFVTLSFWDNECVKFKRFF